MAKKTKEPEAIDIDKIINTVSKDVQLPPSNLQRGTRVRDAVSTGSLALDLCLGGGWPPGRRSNIFGREQVGKSTLMYYAVRACINSRIYVIMYDWEGSTDSDRVERIGVQTEWAKELKKSEPVYFRYYDRMKHGQQMFKHAMEILDRLPDRDTGPVQVAFFCDSLPTVLPAAQADDSETSINALRASLYSSQLPVIKSRLSAKRCCWIDSNQIRTNPRANFGNPEYEMCGEAVKTLSDVRVKAKKAIPPKGRGRAEVKRYVEEEMGWAGDGIDRYNFSRLTVTKNKAFSPNRECDIRLWFEENGQPGRGIDPVYDCYEYLGLTGQIQYHNRPFRHFTIALSPFDKDRKVRVPEVDPKTGEPMHDKDGVVKMVEDTRATWTWKELKELILNPANYQKGRESWNLVAACRRQIQDNSAFGLYFDNINTQAMRGYGSED